MRLIYRIQVFNLLLSLLLLFFICQLKGNYYLQNIYLFFGIAIIYIAIFVFSLVLIYFTKERVTFFLFFLISIIGNLISLFFGRLGYSNLNQNIFIESLVYLNLPILISTLVLLFIFRKKVSKTGYVNK